MAERERGAMMPQSTAGLIRYFDSDEGIKIKPHHVVAVSIGFAGIVVLMRFLIA